MQKYQNNVTDLTGSAVVGVQVTVTTIGGVLATIYSDNGGTEAPNPLTTDANGYIEFYAPDGRYDITVAGAGGYTDVLLADGVEIAENALTKDEAAASDGATKLGTPEGTVQEALDTRVVRAETIADLRAITAPTKPTLMQVAGYYAAEDGGGGEFVWDPTSNASDNGGNVIKPTSVSGAGRWVWQADELSAARWGVLGASDSTARLQILVNYAIGLARAVVINLAPYALINGTVNLNTNQTRFPLYFFGGTLRRTTNVGFMFDGAVKNNSDIFFTSVQFTSTAGAGAKIFNGDKIIRLQTRGCSFRAVDTVFAANADIATSYAQSYRSIGDVVAGGGAGFAFDMVACFDVVFDNLLLEQRESGIRVRRYIYDMKIANSCLEGLTGSAIVIGDDVLSCYSYEVLVEGCYFEANTVANIYIGTAHQRVGPIMVRGCSMLGAGSGGTPAYAEYMISAGGYGNGGLFSDRNYSDQATVIDVTRISGGYATSTWDRNKVGYTYALADKDKLKVDGFRIYSTASGVTTSRLGDFDRLYMSVSQSIAANTTAQVTFDFGTPIALDDIVTPQLQITDGTTLSISHCYRQGNLVRVWVTNKSAGAVTAPLSVSVLKMPFTVSG